MIFMKITKNRGVVEDEVENLQLMEPAEPALKRAISKIKKDGIFSDNEMITPNICKVIITDEREGEVMGWFYLPSPRLDWIC